MARRPAVAVVTDSTSGLPPELAARYGITVVPVSVVVGGRTWPEGDGVSPADVAAALARGVPVSTSRPTANTFRRHLADLVRAGASGVVSVHVSGALSGTVDAARAAAEDAGVPVVVVDSGTVAMGLGMAAVAAARTAAEGADLAAVAARAAAAAAATEVLFCVDSMEHLRRGGRVGAAAGLLGTALSVKPILQVREGRIVVVEKVRTGARAEQRLVERAVEAAAAPAGTSALPAALSHAGVDADAAGGRAGSVDVAVQHVGAPERADAVAAALRAALPDLGELSVSEAGATIAVHTGPGALGVAVLRAAALC